MVLWGEFATSERFPAVWPYNGSAPTVDDLLLELQPNRPADIIDTSDFWTTDLSADEMDEPDDHTSAASDWIDELEFA